MLALSLTLCGWQAKFKLLNPQQPLVNQNLVMKQMQSQQSAQESLSRSGCFSKYIKQNQRWHMMAYCSMAGLFISAIAVLPQAVSFWTCLCEFMCHFSSVQRLCWPSSCGSSPTRAEKWSRGAWCMSWCDRDWVSLFKKVSSVKWKHVGWWSNDWVFIQEIHGNSTAFQLPKWKKLRPLTSHYIAAMAISRALSGSWVAHVKMRRCEMWTVEPR